MKFMNITKRANGLFLMGALAFAATVSFGATALADAPVGVVNMTVVDVTNGSMPNDAITKSSAQPVYPRDTLEYQILVTNQAIDETDQMVDTVVTDSLPAGLTLVSEDNLSLGVVDPFSSVMVNVTATVNSTASGIIENQACFTSSSLDGASSQSGCNISMVNVLAPVATSSSGSSASPSTQPSDSPAPSTSGSGGAGSSATTPDPTTVPDTGGSLTGSSLGISGMATAVTAYIRSRKRK